MLRRGPGLLDQTVVGGKTAPYPNSARFCPCLPSEFVEWATDPAFRCLPPGAVLSFLISEHGLKQADLPEIRSQGVVSEVLSGKRKLNLRQIQLLSERFNLSPVVFIGKL